MSELSKPVAYTDADELRFHHATSDMWPVPLGFGKDVPLYSQEYVSALKQRIAELEAIRSDASQVFKEIGNELGCNPDNESIMMAIDALKERLATPVQLPTTSGRLGVAYTRVIPEVIEAVRAAGFIVEGDE